jgi:hypothetical protein
VNGVVSGAIDANGFLPDPPTLISNALFFVNGTEILIVEFGMPSRHLGWQAFSGEIYQIQYCTNLLQGAWTNGTGVSVTSDVTDVFRTTNAFPALDPVQFMRIQRVGP